MTCFDGRKNTTVGHLIWSVGLAVNVGGFVTIDVTGADVGGLDGYRTLNGTSALADSVPRLASTAIT